MLFCLSISLSMYEKVYFFTLELGFTPEHTFKTLLNVFHTNFDKFQGKIQTYEIILKTVVNPLLVPRFGFLDVIKPIDVKYIAELV